MDDTDAAALASSIREIVHVGDFHPKNRYLGSWNFWVKCRKSAPTHLCNIKGTMMSIQQLCSEGKPHHLLHALRHDNPSQTSLDEAAHEAAFHGHVHCLALVLAAGGDPYTTNSHGDTMLLEAMQSGDIATVQALLQAGYDVNFSPSTDTVQPLHYAMMSGDTEIARLLLGAGVQVDARSPDGDTPLIVAIAMGLTRIVEILLEANADVNAAGFEGFTALHRATQEWEQEIALDLLLTGADPEIPNVFGDSPFLTACSTGNIQVLQLMISKITTPECENKSKQNALHCAALSGNAKIIEPLLQLGVNVQSSDNEGNTPVLIAAQRKYEKFVVKLLTLGEVDVNTKGSRGRTVLHWACVHGLNELVSFLMAQPDTVISMEDNAEETPLLLAAKHKQYPAVRVLVARDVKLNVQDKDGFTPLHWLIKHGEIQLVEQLLDTKKIELDVQDMEGNTPLVLAASLGRWSGMKMLLKKGAKADVSGKNKKTVLHWLSQAGNIEIIRELIDMGCDQNAQDTEMNTPLMQAVTHGQEEVVACLLEAGVDVNRADQRGMTALHHAAGGKHHRIVAQLLRANNIEVNAAMNNGESALLVAAEKGNAAIVMLLLGRSDLNATGASKRTPLWHCCAHGLEECVGELLTRGAKVNNGNSALIQAAMIGCGRIVEKLLEKGALVDDTDYLGRTALMWAVHKGHFEIVKHLVEVGNADVLLGDTTSDTALTIAAWHEQEDILEYLAPKSQLSHCETEEGMDALHLAIAKDNLNMVSTLLQAGASINTVDNSGNTALLAASVHTSGKAILMFLLESGEGFDVDASGSLGRTMLHWCVGDPASVELVLSYGPSLDIVDDSGASPILLAIAHSQPKSVKMLVEAGCDITMIHQDGRSPIHHAVLYGDIEATQLLLSKGIEVNTPTADERTPILLASIEGHADIVDVLIEHHCHINHVYFSAITPLSVSVDRKHFEVSMRLLKAGADPNLIGPDKFPSLVSCVFNNILSGVVLLIQGGADYEGEPGISNTHPLQVAVLRGFHDISLLLLTVSCDMASLRKVYGDLVVLTDNEIVLPTIREMSRRPKALKMLCRREVRKHLPLPMKSSIAKLRAPAFIELYLQMKDLEVFCSD